MDDFGAYSNVNKIVQKDVTGGDSAKNQVGDSYTEQTGNSISRQIGNKNAYQLGYSNSLIVGMSFSTSLAATFSTTVGMSVSTTAGLAIGTNVLGKVALFGGIEASINVSQSIKLVKGDNYTWDTASKNEFGDQKIESDRKKLVIANDLKQLINDATGTYAGDVSVVAAGDIASVCKSHSTKCTGDITLDSFKKTAITGTNELTLLGGSKLTLESFGTVKIDAPAKVTIGGGLININ
jgi:hypothetical protein